MRRLLTVAFVLMFCGNSVLANVQCNEHGAIVTVENGDVFYLGNTCDASKKGGGDGRWWLTASAVAVEINGTVEALIRYDIECDLPSCWAN